MGGNRKTSATKGGKYMNPTDQARKEDRKKQLKKHKKQREQVREAVIKNKNPNSVLEELSKLDDLEFDTENECPYADRVMQEKRLRLRSTYFKILEYYKNTGKMDTWKDYQDDFNTYEKERDRKKSLYQAVLKAKNWSVDHIPLPDMPMPDGSGFPISAPMGLPPKKLEITKTNNRIPPGPPPGPPPGKFYVI
jgi:WW domain-binding protein 11